MKMLSKTFLKALPNLSRRHLAALAVGAGIFLALASDGAAVTCTVPSGFFATIQSAVDNVLCAQINVLPGTYTEQLVIDRDVKLKGAGAATTIIQAPAILDLETDGDGTSIVEITGDGNKVAMKGFTIQGPLGGITSAIRVHDGANATIEKNIVLGTDALSGTLDGNGITVGSSFTDEDSPAIATIADNEISGFHRVGIAVIGPGSKAVIKNNIVTGGGPSGDTTQQGITIQDGADGEISKNTVQNLKFTGPAPQTAVAIFFFDSSHDILISRNKLLETQTGILLQATENIRIFQNKITDLPGSVAIDKGIWLLGRSSTGLSCVGGDGVTPGMGCATSARLGSNRLTGDGTGAGVVVGKPPEDPFDRAPSTATLTHNTIGGWEISILVLPSGSINLE